MAEVFSMIFSNFLLQKMRDISAFYVVFFIGIVSYTILICDNKGGILVYVAVVLMVISNGGWNNANLLIMEMRVPPSNIASVAIVIRTLASASGIGSASVAAIAQPYSFVVLVVISFTGFLASFFLPAPGQYLDRAN